MFELDEPYVGKEELNYLKQAIESGWISAMGPFVKKFEEEFAKYIGVKYAVSCASGTSATSLLCPTLQIKPGDEVILQSLTFTADAWAMHQAGAKIIFADCAKDTFSIDPEDVRKKISKKTKIISPTHLYGRASKMDALREICDENNIYLIEDCCQAMGSKYKNKMVGSIGDFNFYSFHNKLIASGEGGMITTNDKNLADRFDKLKNPPAVNRPEERDGFTEISMNHRLSNLHAAVGLAQLERLEKNIKKKERMAEIYDEIFEKSEGISLITDWTVGFATFIVSFVVLLAWIPLRQIPGIGTIANAFIVASMLDLSLPYLPKPDLYLFQILQSFIGVLIVGFGAALYLSANLGPGARDGLMTGLTRVTNLPFSIVRSTIEISVVITGWFLGGTVGIGTLLFAFLVGPSISVGCFFLNHFVPSRKHL